MRQDTFQDENDELASHTEIPIISSAVNRILREKCPKRFGKVDEEFSQKFAEIDEQIADLQKGIV